jgi:hypothetical protein
MHARIIDQRPALSTIVILPIWTVVMEIHYIVLGLVASYAVLCGLFYNPAISAMWAEASMMWIRVDFGFDPVHFIGGSYWWENSLAIVEPIARKLFDVFDFGLGSLLLKLALSRALLSLLDAKFIYGSRSPGIQEAIPTSLPRISN